MTHNVCSFEGTAYLKSVIRINLMAFFALKGVVNKVYIHSTGIRCLKMLTKFDILQLTFLIVGIFKGGIMWKKKQSVVIAGCGRFGSNLAGTLSNQGYNVIIIDQNGDSFRKLPQNFSGFQVMGDVTDPDLLVEAKIEEAVLFIAATDNDNVNCMISQIASRIYSVNEVFVRLNDTQKEYLLDGSNIQAIYPSLLSIEDFNRRSTIGGVKTEPSSFFGNEF